MSHRDDEPNHEAAETPGASREGAARRAGAADDEAKGASPRSRRERAERSEQELSHRDDHPEPAHEADPNDAGTRSLERAVECYYRELVDTGRGAAASFRSTDSAYAPEDMAQEAIVRLLERGPAAWIDDAPELPRLRAWVRTTATRVGQDLAARRTFRRAYERAAREADARRPPATAPAPDATHDAKVELGRMRAHLRATYPLGARMFELALGETAPTTEELALLLETSDANVYQIGTRMRAELRRGGWG